MLVFLIGDLYRILKRLKAYTFIDAAILAMIIDHYKCV